jgi:hypothetical protein
MKLVGYTLLGLAALVLLLKCAVARSHARNEGGGAPVLDAFLGVPLLTTLGLWVLFPQEEHGTLRWLGILASVLLTVGALLLASSARPKP